ncbi:LysR family transcriptional regulator [Pigmentiphaga sp. NML080357]|uniref:LysR substrate-binding domain-containing protein n=1 Tax=Pigmentiphaga sp. NML080357 TaxID=2008675 RepID=UPI000B414AE2|nr:LysR substrate-binding domain-containing protein [Pigmentiphaga sp. NML080357]OVZ63745.1 LysR family transcriptional regulator [Pigmentiphaga sp. NML080357]
MSKIAAADLSCFLAIARHRNFRRAAAEMGCTPSALSHALRSLEERMDLRLFNRTTRSVALTEAGERLYARVAPAFRDIDDALEDLNALRDKPMGTLRINAARAAAQMALLPAVTSFLASHPGIKVELAINNALIDMVSEGFDAGVRLGETLAQDMIAVPLGPRQRSAIVASPAFFKQHPKPSVPQQLKALPCVRLRFADGRYYAWEFKRGDVELAVDVDGPLSVDDQELAIDAALAGTGLAFAFEAQVEHLIRRRRLVRVLEEWCPDYPGLYLYYPSRRQMPGALRAFVEHLGRTTASKRS